MKVSIITVCYNSEKYISSCIDSVLNQVYNNIEYIVIDGNSSDRTTDIIRSYKDKISIYISEPDNGIYDAMNKGIRLSTGEIIGILNSDDYFANNQVIGKVVEAFKNENIDAIYGDVRFINPDNPEKTIRYYSSKNFKFSSFKYGIMPAHPSFYIKRIFFEKFGYYRTDYKIASDFELMLRFFSHREMKLKYIPMTFVTMRKGGVSTRNFFSQIILNREILKACLANNIKTNVFKIYSKYASKIFELMHNSR
jgi:glycosyltransferase involved in cell wall biosynthesis